MRDKENIRIKDSAQPSVAPGPQMSFPSGRNVKQLSLEEAALHLPLLSYQLRLLSRLVYDKLPNDGGSNNELQRYINSLATCTDALYHKHQLQPALPNSDIALSCAIDPTDSGFPLFIRDLHLLSIDKEAAKAKLAQLPPQEKLVEDAIYLLFKLHLPEQQILQSREREYCEKLDAAILPRDLEIFPLMHAGEEDGVNYCRKSIARFEPNTNLPYFYTLSFTVPRQSYARNGWHDQLDAAIKEGLSTIIDAELPYLAKVVEAIEGVNLQIVERFTIGPFYSNITDNEGAIAALLDGERSCDSLLYFRKHAVQRIGQQERKGFKERWNAWWSGDKSHGVFSPEIMSPQYILLPHELSQQAHHKDLSFKGPVKMYGITNGGDIFG